MPARSAPRPPEPNGDLHGIYQTLGELIATVREIKHSTNNNSQKIDGIGVLASTQAELVKRVEDLDLRVKVLEVIEERRRGAVGALDWLSRHWPFTVILAALAAFVAWVNGKLG